MAAHDNLHQGQFFATPDPAPQKQSLQDSILPEYGEMQDAVMRTAATAPMRVRTIEHGLHGILHSGRFKTQHETNYSMGTLDPEWRQHWEEQTFGPGARPVYGHFSHGDIVDEGKSDDPTTYGQNVSDYGDIAFELKEHVRKHTTFSATDSLDTEGYVTEQGQRPKVPLPLARDYTEMQVHPDRMGRPLGLRDISKAILYPDADKGLTEERAETLSTDLRNAGIRHEIRRVGLGGQQVLPLSQDQWGSAAAGGVPKDEKKMMVSTERRGLRGEKVQF